MKIKDKKTAFVIYVVLFIVLWNVAEFLWLTLAGKGYDGVSGADILTPLTAGIVTGYLFFIAQGVDINDELELARETDGAVIVDVRDAGEYAQGHVPGAVNVSVDELEKIRSVVPDKTTPLFTYCLRGSRSSRAVKILKAMGYKQVIDMGGINKYKGELAE